MRRNTHLKVQLVLLLSIIGLVFMYWGPVIFYSLIPGDQTALRPERHKSRPLIIQQLWRHVAPEPSFSAPSPSPTPAEPTYTEAEWIAVGDVMMHAPQVPGAYDKAAKRYNFDPFFEEVSPILKQGDWVIANLETPVAGPKFGYNGYPHFNAPVELAEALKNAGFNLITNANNHSLDQGAEGLLLTLKNLKALGLPYAGTAATQEEADSLLLSEKNGIVMGLLAYTYGTNGIKIPTDKPYLVSLIDEQRIVQDIARLREAGADFITVSLHFGTEYKTSPNDSQKQLARSLIAAGADIIAGSHPHVVQPYEVWRRLAAMAISEKDLLFIQWEILFRTNGAIRRILESSLK